MCDRVVLPGGATAIVCYGHRPTKKCRFCPAPATLLCDCPIAENQVGEPITCDAPICEKCSTRVGLNRDHCPRHATHAVKRTVRDPSTREQLERGGYRFAGRGTCRGCTCAIEWWKTPSNKNMPMRVQPDGRLISHFADCPNRRAFRAANRAHDERVNGKPAEQAKLF